MEINMIIIIILKVTAMGMGIASLILGFFPKETSNDTHFTMLSIGLVALGIASIM